MNEVRGNIKPVRIATPEITLNKTLIEVRIPDENYTCRIDGVYLKSNGKIFVS